MFGRVGFAHLRSGDFRLRVLILGATGLIGSTIAARLHRDGMEIAGVARSMHRSARALPVDRWIRLDLREAADPSVWLPHLAGVDAVVNAAGVLQDNARDSTRAVHDRAPAALWKACEQAGVRRIVQISALGIDGGATDFSSSKRAGDAALARSALDWVILRPSVVIGRPAYGGSALMRGLAGLPLLPRMPQAGFLDVVTLDDVVETVSRMLRPDAPSRVTLDLAGPERLRFEDVVQSFRRWLGRPSARLVTVPDAVMALAWRVGDLLAWLGWRSPIRTTARREILRGSTGDPAEWTRLTGIRPGTLGDWMAANPATVQERWFSALYLLKPLMLGVFALFWLLTGIVSLGPGFEAGEKMMRAAGAGPLSAAGVIAGAVADIGIGVAILFRRTARLALVAAFLLSLLYLIAGSLLAPELWRDPLGPLMKIWPILVLNLACLAVLEER